MAQPGRPLTQRKQRKRKELKASFQITRFSCSMNQVIVLEGQMRSVVSHRPLRKKNKFLHRNEIRICPQTVPFHNLLLSFSMSYRFNNNMTMTMSNIAQRLPEFLTRKRDDIFSYIHYSNFRFYITIKIFFLKVGVKE